MSRSFVKFLQVPSDAGFYPEDSAAEKGQVTEYRENQ